MKYKLDNDNFREDYGKNLLKARGIYDIDAFLNPTENNLLDPFSLERIEEGIELLDKVIKAKKEILLIVDSDVDGYTSAAIIYQYIRKLNPGAPITYWLHTGKQHGLEPHIRRILESNIHYGLVILPDASSNDYEYHERLKEIGTPVLVIDHHLADPPFSDNAIIINNQLSPKYANKALTGSGMALQFCRAYDKKIGTNHAEQFYDLAAVGIVSDMASVIDLENRYILRKGLKYPTENVFLNTVYKSSAYSIAGSSSASDKDLNNAINPTAVAWYVGPLINALIRVGTAEEKENLFQAFIDGEQMVISKKRGANGALEKVAVEVVREGTNAKNRQKRIREKMMGQLEVKIINNNLLENKILVVELDEEDDFPPELNGLMAMGISQRYSRPALVVRRNNQNYLKGSARGPSDSSMESLKIYLTDTGLFEFAEGHDFAFGLSLDAKKLDEFIELSNEELHNVDFGESYHKVNFIRSAMEEDIEDLIYDLCEYDNLWGQQNPAPLIAIENISIPKDEIDIIGKSDNTLKIEKNGITYIKFNSRQLIMDILDRKEEDFSINIVGKPNLNEWLGNVTPQIIIEDIEISDGKYSF